MKPKKEQDKNYKNFFLKALANENLGNENDNSNSSDDEDFVCESLGNQLTKYLDNSKGV